jgi:hypothetical protein
MRERFISLADAGGLWKYDRGTAAIQVMAQMPGYAVQNILI